MIKGWLLGLVSWFAGAEEEFASSMISQDLTAQMRTADIENLVLQGIPLASALNPSPRLAAWLQSQLPNYEFTPWAIFQD